MGPGVSKAEGHIDERMAASMRDASAQVVVDVRVAVHATSVGSHREGYRYRVCSSPGHGKQDEVACLRHCYSQQKLQAPLYSRKLVEISEHFENVKSTVRTLCENLPFTRLGALVGRYL